MRPYLTPDQIAILRVRRQIAECLYENSLDIAVHNTLLNELKVKKFDDSLTAEQIVTYAMLQLLKLKVLTMPSTNM